MDTPPKTPTQTPPKTTAPTPTPTIDIKQRFVDQYQRKLPNTGDHVPTNQELLGFQDQVAQALSETPDPGLDDQQLAVLSLQRFPQLRELSLQCAACLIKAPEVGQAVGATPEAIIVSVQQDRAVDTFISGTDSAWTGTREAVRIVAYDANRYGGLILDDVRARIADPDTDRNTRSDLATTFGSIFTAQQADLSRQLNKGVLQTTGVRQSQKTLAESQTRTNENRLLDQLTTGKLLGSK